MNKDIVDMVSLLKSESFLFLTLPKQSDKCVYYHNNLLSCFAKLSVRTSNYKEQKDSSWLMVRWAGGNKRFIHLWYKVNGSKGKLRCQGGKKKPKNRWMKRHCNMGCYKEKNLQRNVSHLFECTVIPWGIGSRISLIYQSLCTFKSCCRTTYTKYQPCVDMQILHPEITIFFYPYLIEKNQPLGNPCS